MSEITNHVIAKLDWMRGEKIWPNGLRYLWTDAFGVVLLVSLYNETGDKSFLDQAEWLVAEVERVLGRERGLRIGEAPDRDGQYFHYLAMWIFALTCLGCFRPEYRDKAIALVRDIHEPFLIPGVGVVWKMKEDLSGPYPGYGLGALDAFHGYVVYRILDEKELESEIEEMSDLVEGTADTLNIDQDLGVGMMLWMTHCFPDAMWAVTQRRRCIKTLDTMWIDPPGYFCRHPHLPNVRFAFTNYGVSLGLQCIGHWDDRVAKLNSYFERYRSGDEYDRDPITHVMGCTSAYPGLWREPIMSLPRRTGG